MDYDNEMMSVRTMVAKNREEAKRILFDQYGTNYDIRSTRNIPNPGFLGLFSKDRLEVTYTVNNLTPKPKPTSYGYSNSKPQDSFSQSRDAILQSAAESLKKSGSSVETVMLKTQLVDISKQLEQLSQKMDSNVQQSQSDLHPTIRRIQDLLSKNEFSYKYIQEITEKIRKTFSIEELESFELVERKVVDWIGDSINVMPKRVHRKPHVVIIIGPTGVGKTTTLVKLATQFYLAEKEKLEKNKRHSEARFCFITTDTMRVAALNQLSSYGEILDKDVLVAQSKDEVTKLFEEHKDYEDAIFIDTGGYGPNDASRIADMKNTLSVQGLNPDIYLAVTASTKASDLHNIMQNYELFGYQSVIITKCDESLSYGNIISVLHERHKSVSYVTNGQNIRSTIAEANVIEFLKRLDGFNIDRIHIEDRFSKDDNFGE